MKNILLLLVLSGALWAQGSNKPTIIPFPGAPTGSCSPAQEAVNSSNGDLYDCVSAVWTKVGSTGGGLPSGTGVVRVASGSGSAAEMSGFGTTSGSNALVPGVVASGKTLTIQSGGTLTCAAGSTCPSGGAMVNIAGSVTATGCTVTNGACTVSGSSTITVTFSVIPGTYSSLIVMVIGRVDDSANNEPVSLQFNADTGSNYDYSRLYGGSSGPGNSNSTGQTTAQGVYFNGASAAANFASQVVYTVVGYAGTTFFKTVTAQNQSANSGSAGVIDNQIMSGAWRSTSAITSVSLIDGGGGHWVAGSTFYIYGVL